MIFLFLFAILNALIGETIQQQSHRSSSKDYDYLLLELTWPITFCLRTRCSIIPQHFTIHGNWPNRWDKRLVTYCQDYTEGQEDLRQETSGFESRLSEAWPALKRGDHLDFWDYQWKKHGACSTQTPSLRGMKNFFLGSLNLYEQLRVDEVLGRLDYVPRNMPYDSNRFFQDLKSFYGVSPNIKCLNVNGASFLKNIDFCFDKISLEMINCNGQISCKRDLIIPERVL